MTIPRIYLPQYLQKGGLCVLRGKELKYLKAVLRMKAGEHLFLYDGQGYESEAILKSYTAEGATIKIIGKNRIQNNPVNINLFQSLPKSGTMDLVIWKATELGVEKIIPFASIRSVAKIPPEKIPAKCTRWRKIAQEAARKCGRANIPEVAGVMSFDDILKLPHQDETKIIFWEEEQKTTIKQIFLNEQAKKSQAFSVIVGPEGGFSGEEVARAVEMGFTSVSLSNQILKVDTAVMAILAIIQYERGIFSSAYQGGLSV